MKKIPILAFMLFLAVGASAQTVEKSVEKIRSLYNEVSEKTRLAETDDDRGEFGELFMNELVINKRNHQWRAVGVYGLTYKFFYKGGNSEGHMYPDELVLVKVENKVSNRTYWSEYLYSDSGVLLYFFEKAQNDERGPLERRIYFAGPKAVRIIEDTRTRDHANAQAVPSLKPIIEQSARIKEIFNKSIKL